MYPLGAEIAKKIRHKADRKFWEQNWDSSIEGAWPKLFHYRVRLCRWALLSRSRNCSAAC